MIPKLFMASTAGIFDLLHRWPKITGLVGLNLADNHQFTGGGFKGASQVLKVFLFLPDIALGAGVIFFAQLRKMFPGFTGQCIKLHGTVSAVSYTHLTLPTKA